MELKSHLLAAIPALAEADTQALKAIYFENGRAEETAWIIFGQKKSGTENAGQFAVSAMSFLLRKNFFEEDSLGSLEYEEFKTLDVEKAKAIIDCTPFKLTPDLAKELQNGSLVTAIYDDWNYRIYILEAPNAFICFAWMTTA